MARTTATSRLFLRTRSTVDLDGARHWLFREAAPRVITPESVSEYLRRQWEIIESRSGVRTGTLKARDANGSLHTRALRRIEEDHLMKFAIRD
jgi:hypothetical protein